VVQLVLIRICYVHSLQIAYWTNGIGCRTSNMRAIDSCSCLFYSVFHPYCRQFSCGPYEI